MDRQKDRLTDRRTRVKQYAPDLLMRGHKNPSSRGDNSITRQSRQFKLVSCKLSIYYNQCMCKVLIQNTVGGVCNTKLPVFFTQTDGHMEGQTDRLIPFVLQGYSKFLKIL